jgi:LEA14-like dessication related protein
MSNKTKLIVLNVGLIAVIAVALFAMFKYPNFEKAINLEVVDRTDRGFIARTSIIVRNDNFFSIKGKDIVVKLYYKDSLIGETKGVDDVSLKRKSSDTIGLNVEFHLAAMRNDLPTLMKTKDSIAFDIQVEGKFSMFGSNKSEKTRIYFRPKDFVPMLIEDGLGNNSVTLNEVKLKKVEATTSTFDFKVHLKNTLPLDVQIKNVWIDVFADKDYKKRVGEWLGKQPNKLKPGEEGDVSGDLAVNNLYTAVSGVTSVISGDFEYFVDGQADVVVDDYQITVPISTSFKYNPSTNEITITSGK